jgi:hypothetical protein
MDRSALKIRNVMSAEILHLEYLLKAHETGHDSDGVGWPDKIKVLKQLITTIDGMEKRGEI